MKISKNGQNNNGILQFEYAMATGQYGGLYWDLSDLDGRGMYFTTFSLADCLGSTVAC